MITNTTTIAELAEVLRAHGALLVEVRLGKHSWVAYVGTANRPGAWDVDTDLAAAISAALAKAGAR